MGKNTLRTSYPLLWDPTLKESWHLALEDEPINDDRWSCIVMAMVPFTLEDDECIEIFNRSVANGTRKTIKTISLIDVITLLNDHKLKNEEKQKASDKKSKNDKDQKGDLGLKTNVPEKIEEKKKKLKPPSPRYPSIIDLALKYIMIMGTEFLLPPELMAGVLKYLILNLKDENIFEKRVEAAKKKKIMQLKVKADFVKSMKPFKPSAENDPSDVPAHSTHKKQKAVSDHPFLGPDLYVVLSDFFNPYYFTELLRIKVPFVAIFKIANFKTLLHRKFSQIVFPEIPDGSRRKLSTITNFWTSLEENCKALESTVRFKDFILMEYQPQLLGFKSIESQQLFYDCIFDEMSAMVYDIYLIYQEHKFFLQDIYVQRLIVSLEPLNLAECNIYNKLCDSLITGDSNTVVLVFYALLEQVIAGVPHTESMPSEYSVLMGEDSSRYTDSSTYRGTGFRDHSEKNYSLVTPCLECREKFEEKNNFCEHIRNYSAFEKSEWSEITEDISILSDRTLRRLEFGGESYFGQYGHYEKEFCITESMIEQSAEREGQKCKTYKTPMICFSGDQFVLQNCFYDRKLLNPEHLFDRFFRKTFISQLWSKYPKLEPGKSAFYRMHFLKLLNVAGDPPETFKLKFFFALIMKIIGIMKFYFYQKDEPPEESIREFSPEKSGHYSKVKFDLLNSDSEAKKESNIRPGFFKIFNVEESKKKVRVKEEVGSRSTGSVLRDHSSIRKANTVFNMSIANHRSSGPWVSYLMKMLDYMNPASSSAEAYIDQEADSLTTTLDCYDITNLTEASMLKDTEEYTKLIKDFNFYEILEPRRMIQKLLEAQDDFNTTQCVYFAPSDTLIIIVYNESDHRGISFNKSYGRLLTPVALRDYYSHISSDLSRWSDKRKTEYEKFVTMLKGESKKEIAKKKIKYLSTLKERFEAMTEEEKENFLNKDFNYSHGSKEHIDIEIKEEDLKELPIKPKYRHSKEMSFVGTNFIDICIETESQLTEYFSKDGTEISLRIDSWLFRPMRVLMLMIKLSKLKFIYHQKMEEAIDSTFTVKTLSDITFVFYKDDDDLDKFFWTFQQYKFKISWPTGLNIQNLLSDKMRTYIKQNYYDPYKSKCGVKNEVSRCFLKNGQILIFKNNDEVEVLCGSGTRHILKEFSKNPDRFSAGNEFSDSPYLSVSHYETITPTGEIWQKSNKGACKNKVKLIDTVKVYVGVDPLSQETYYKRDDGVSCMLWPNGKLVVNYPDGTKITSTPNFDEEEVSLEWTEREKFVLGEIEMMSHFESSTNKPKSKTILKKLIPTTEISNNSQVNNDSFVSISISYLMEHPKYSSVFYDSQNSSVEIRMPNEVSIKIDSVGNYTINQDENFLHVEDDLVTMYKNCTECRGKSKATIFLHPNETLCKFVNFFKDTFTVNRDGETKFHEHTVTDSHTQVLKKGETPSKMATLCAKCKHHKPLSLKQKCFAFERDLSGVEFIHSDVLGRQCYDLPDDTFYQLNCKSKDGSYITHLFSSPYYKMNYENWTMEYEEKENSLPTNLKKKDLKEFEAKDSSKNLFKYPFPRNRSRSDSNSKADINQRPTQMPKAIVTRIFKCFSTDPLQVVQDVKNCVLLYQKEGHDLHADMKKRKIAENENAEANRLKKKLQKIASAFNQSKAFYPHLSTQIPSTEEEIHCMSHFVNLMSELETEEERSKANLPQCKQIPLRLPRNGNLDSIDEGNEAFGI